MYSAPRPAPAPRSGGFAAAPLVAICCLLFIIFLIGATIVLALIPVYTPRKGQPSTASGSTYNFRANPNGAVGQDGSLDSTGRSAFNTAIDNSRRLRSGSTRTSRAIFATNPTGGKRRRRAYDRTRSRRFPTSRGDQQLYLTCGFNAVTCGSKCLSSGFSQLLAVFTVTVTFFYNPGIYGFVAQFYTFTFSFTLVTSGFAIPATLGPTTTTIITSTSTSSSSTSASVTTSGGGSAVSPSG